MYLCYVWVEFQYNVWVKYFTQTGSYVETIMFVDSYDPKVTMLGYNCHSVDQGCINMFFAVRKHNNNSLSIIYQCCLNIVPFYCFISCIQLITHRTTNMVNYKHILKHNHVGQRPVQKHPGRKWKILLYNYRCIENST